VRERELRALLPSTGAPHPMGEMTSPRLWPLKWLLNGGPRAAPGLGTPLAVGRAGSRPAKTTERGTTVLVVLADQQGTPAAAHRSRYHGHPSRHRNSSAEATARDGGGAGQSTKHQRLSIKGLEGMGPAARPGWRVSLMRRLLRGLQGPITTCSPLIRAVTANRLLPDGIGLVRVSGA
jgi:hypothetical protein